MKQRRNFSAHSYVSHFQGYLFQIFIGFCALSIVLICATAYTVSQTSMDRLLKKEQSSNQRLLTQIAQNFDSLNHYITECSSNLYLLDDVSRLLHTPELSDVTQYLTVRNVRANTKLLPFIDSIYFYNAVNDKCYCFYINQNSAVKLYSSAELPDQDATQIMKGQSLSPLIPYLRKNVALLDDRSDVLTYALYEKNYETSQLYSCIVFNVMPQWLLDNSVYINMDPASTIVIAGEEGRILADTSQSFGTHLSGQAFYQTSRALTDSTGAYTASIENETYFIAYYHLPNPDFYFYSLIPMEKLYGDIHSVVRTTVLISISLLLLAIFAAFLVSKRLSRPVIQLYQNMQTLCNLTPPAASNEFSGMNLIVTQTRKKLMDLETEHSHTLYLVRLDFLRKLLQKRLGEEDLKNSLASLSMSLRPVSPTFLLLADYEAGDLLFWDASGQKTDAPSVLLQKIFPPHLLLSEVLIFSQSRSVFFLQPCDASLSYDEIFKLLVTPIQQLQNEFRTANAHGCTLALSRLYSGLAEMAHAYQETSELMEYRLIQENDAVLTTQYLDECLTQFPDFLAEQAESLQKALKNGQLDLMVNLHNSIWDSLTAFSIDTIRYSIFYLSIMVFQSIYDLEKTGFSFEVSYSKFIDTIFSSADGKRINDEFILLYQSVASVLQQDKDQKNPWHPLACKVRQYVLDHYDIPYLSLNLIAKELKYSTSYLGQVFHANFNTSVSGFINDVRLEKATALLKGSDLAIDKILEQIGWESQKYFFTVFKKKYGMTPMQYRMIHRGDE